MGRAALEIPRVRPTVLSNLICNGKPVGVGDCVWLGVDDAVPVKDAVIEMVELCVEDTEDVVV